MHDHLLSFRIHYPNLAGLICKIKRGLDVGLCRSVESDATSIAIARRTLVVTEGITRLNLSGSQKTDVRLQPSVRAQAKSRLNVDLAGPVFPHKQLQDILNLLLNTRVARLLRRHDDMFSLDEFMLPPIVGELFELLECYKRVFMILNAQLQ
jgi:hypothetical protein